MKIGTKLGICFIALAVVPLGAASVVYLRTTHQFGNDMAAHGKDLLENWVHRDLRRASELGAVTIEETRDAVAREVRFLAGDIASRLASGQDASSADAAESGFILDGTELPDAGNNGATKIDLQQMSVHLAADATRDQIAGTLERLSGLNEIARTIYLRNRDAIDTLTVTFESGLTISYPGRVVRFDSDPRETNWYLSTLEALQTGWFDGADGRSGRIAVTSPVQYADGRLAGAARISIRLDALLARSVDATRLPPGADAYLFNVPKDDPELMPYRIASFGWENGEWDVAEHPQPITLNGDDAWLKVVSDIRSGVPGLQNVERDGNREVWSFGPAGATAGSSYHIAVSLPADVISVVTTQVEEVVEDSFDAQFRTAVIFALVAGFVAAGLAVIGARTLTSPVRRLHEAAARLGRGDFSVRVEHPGGDEIGDLARGFNRMVPALEEQLRVKRDLFAAQEIQQHLVPAQPPEIEGFEIAGRTVYCDETGGDYQDYVPLREGQYAVVVGDVTGHGVGAALMMASARALIRANAAHHETASGLLSAVNKQLTADSTGGRSLTLFFMLLRDGSRDIDWISAGHEPALVYDPDTEDFTLLEGEDIPLGVDGDWEFNNRRTTLPEGGLLVAFTDGIREARNGDGEEYGVKRLKDVVQRSREKSSGALLEAVFADLATFRGDTAATDDVSVVVIKPS
ncbi:MAG: SpoIIE family protein phosphatase [Rhodospirillales bacterium]